MNYLWGGGGGFDGFAAFLIAYRCGNLRCPQGGNHEKGVVVRIWGGGDTALLQTLGCRRLPHSTTHTNLPLIKYLNLTILPYRI